MALVRLLRVIGFAVSCFPSQIRIIMEVGRKRFRGFHSQEPSRDLQVVKPYWVARNFIPPVLHDKCQGQHSLIKLPMMKHFLRKGHFKLFTEENMSKEWQQSDLAFWRDYRKASQYDSADCRKLEETHRRKPKRYHHKHKSSVGQSQLQNDLAGRAGDSTSKLTGSSRDCVLLQRPQRQQQRQQRQQRQPFKIYKSDIGEGNADINKQKGQKEQKQQRTGLPSLRQRISRYGESSHLSPNNVSDRASLLPLKEKERSQEGRGQAAVELLKMSSNKPKLSRFPSILVKHELSFTQCQPSESSIIHYDKNSLLEQYKQTAKILQTTLKKEEKGSGVNGRRIMSLIATLDILKGDLAAQNVNVVLQRYMAETDCRTVQKIEKVLEKNTQYRELSKGLKEEYHASNLVAKKISKSQEQQELLQPTAKIRKKKTKKVEEQKEQEEQGEQGENKQNNYSIAQQIHENHQRYQSDNLLSGRKAQETQAIDVQRLKKQTSRKGVKKKGRLNKQEQIKSKKLLYKKVPSLPNTLKKIAKQAETKLPKDQDKHRHKKESNLKGIQRIELPQLNQEILQQIRTKNHHNARRPNTHKNRRQTRNQSIVSYGSQKTLKRHNERRTTRISLTFSLLHPFLHLQHQRKSKSIRASRLVSKFQSHMSTPPELINQIDDSSPESGPELPQNKTQKKKEKEKQKEKEQSIESSSQHSQTSSAALKTKVKGRINRFHIDMYDKIDISYPSSENQDEDEEEDQSDSQYSKSRRQNSLADGSRDDWDGIARRIPKKKNRRTLQKERKTRLKLRRLFLPINTKVMEGLHEQVYRVLHKRGAPELQQVRGILLENQRQIRVSRMKQTCIGTEGCESQQKWIDELDFAIHIKTNHRERIGSMKTSMIIIRHDVENDPVDLYQIACRESQLVDRLQEKERLEIFAKESMHLVERRQVDEGIVSYGF